MIELYEYQLNLLQEIFEEIKKINNSSLGISNDYKKQNLLYLKNLLINIDEVTKICLIHDYRCAIELGNYLSSSNIKNELKLNEDDLLFNKIEKLSFKSSSKEKDELLEEILKKYGYDDKIPSKKDISKLSGKEKYDAKILSGREDNIFVSSIPTYVPNLRVKKL